jgi:thioredoxin-dependent peroxiredoxin
MTMPEAGDRAPDLALPDEAGEIHRLSDQAGRWTIVYFYPEDDTAGCTTEACQFRDLNGPILDQSADVWGISPDPAASHARFRAKFDLPFTLLSDEDHEVSTRWGAWTLRRNDGREYMDIQRSSYLVDPEGKIAYAWHKVKADGHPADVLAKLAAARVAASPGG